MARPVRKHLVHKCPVKGCGTKFSGNTHAVDHLKIIHKFTFDEIVLWFEKYW